VPSGAFVRRDGEPYLVLDDAVVHWSTQGYGRRRPRPRSGDVELITPPATAAALRAGYRPQVDPSATAS